MFNEDNYFVTRLNPALLYPLRNIMRRKYLRKVQRKEALFSYPNGNIAIPFLE